LNLLAWLFSACTGFYIAPAGRRLVAAGGAMPPFGVAQPVDSRFSYSFAPAGQRSVSSAPAGGGHIEYLFHGFRFAGIAGCAPPVATIRRPIRGEKHQANNNDKKVLHKAMNFNRTPRQTRRQPILRAMVALVIIAGLGVIAGGLPAQQATQSQPASSKNVGHSHGVSTSMSTSQDSNIDEVIVLWPGQACSATSQGQTVAGKETYPNNWAINIQAPTLLAHLADPKIATGSAVIICPGGGYGGLAIDKEGHAIAEWLNTLGISAFVLKYRMPEASPADPKDPLPLQDVRRAMRLVRSRAEEFHLKTNQIGVCGASAGGHLASAISTHFDSGLSDAPDAVDRVSCRPDFSILLYPVITMDQACTHGGSRDKLIGKHPDAALVEYFSSERQVTAQTPPAFLVHASDDKSVPPENSIRYYQALQRLGINAELHIYPHGGHGFGMVPQYGVATTWPARCADWLAGLKLAK
jgi:acetyl esterase/lipase